MVSKRLELSQKALFVVPNHITEQTASEFLRLYPTANILVVSKKDFEMKNRKRFCAKITTGDYDAIIMGHSQLEKIPISFERQQRLMEAQIDEITVGIMQLQDEASDRITNKNLERTKKSLEAKQAKLLESKTRDSVVTFEELGVDRLYIDEAHNYKDL
jgi:N12 class adenine-specific DNA methylase